MAKDRIQANLLVYEQGLVFNREKAKRLIMAGSVVHGSERIDKPGQFLSREDQLRLRDQMRYVSRGGYKPEKILEKEKVDLKEKACIDVGASTGDFIDCILQHGAKEVYCINAGYNQLDYSLRQNPQAVNMEKVNIRHLDPEALAEKADLINVDVFFTPLELVLDAARDPLKDRGQICALVKSQFEAGKSRVSKGGIARDPRVHLEVLNKMARFFKDLDLGVEKLVLSPIHGTKGDIGFLALLKKNYQEEELGPAQIVKNVHASREQDAG